jgi:hypothetical protein
MVDERSNNEKAFDVFRKRLTEGFYAIDPDTGDRIEDEAHQRALDSTKPWRNELWKAFNQLERDTNPFTALKQDKLRAMKAKDK